MPRQPCGLMTLRRRIAAIARACGVAGHPRGTKHPAIRETLRGIGRKHDRPSRRAAARRTHLGVRLDDANERAARPPSVALCICCRSYAAPSISLTRVQQLDQVDWAGSLS
jgi:hypothetical protein